MPTSASPSASAPGAHGISDLDDARFRLLVESVRDYAIFMLDAEGTVVSWNEGAERIKGYAAHEIVGRHFSAFYPSEDVAGGKPALELEHAARDGRFEDEGWRVRRDGSRFWANVVVTALRAPDGRLVGFAKVTRDLTERRAAEERAIVHARAMATEEASRQLAEERANELASLLEQVQNQAVELEQQAEEAQAVSEELEQANEELQRANEAVEEARLRAERLLALASGLAEARTTDEVADIALREATATVGADAAALAMLTRPLHDSADDGSAPPEFIIIRRTGYAEALNQRFTRFPVAAGRPMSDAVLTRRPVLISTAAEWRERYPAMAAQTGEMGYEAMANVPIMEHGLALAGMTFSFREPRQFDEATRTFLATVGEQCGLALGRARAFEAERRAREASAFLAEASGILTASLDYEATLRALARAAVPRLADWCVVDVLVNPLTPAWPPELERLAIVHQDPARVAWVGEMTRRFPTDWSSASGLARTLGEGVTEFYPRVTDEMLVAAARSPEHLATLRELGFAAVIIVPLIARGRTFGAFTLVMAESERQYDEADRTLAEQLAERAALAIDNARLFRDAEKARAVAEEANRAKMDFLAVMSHELRTPLNAIAGYTQLLELGVHGPVTDEQRADLARIRDSGRHLLGLINDVLNYAKLEAGKVEFLVGEVMLDQVVEDVAALVVPQASERGLSMVIEPAPPDVRAATGTRTGVRGVIARADREKVRQILLNLLSNAIKYTPAGGAITLIIGGDDRHATVRVRDTGVGIPADKLERVFEPFVQLGRSLTSRAEGTGLGLAISRDLAQTMGGDLTAESTVDVGSTFTLTLPAAGTGAR